MQGVSYEFIKNVWKFVTKVCEMKQKKMLATLATFFVDCLVQTEVQNR